jgi:hypothetical protein
MNDVLGIQSPSRVAEIIGEFLDEGLAVGIEGGGRAPRAAAELAETVAADLSDELVARVGALDALAEAGTFPAVEARFEQLWAQAGEAAEGGRNTAQELVDTRQSVIDALGEFGRFPLVEQAIRGGVADSALDELGFVLRERTDKVDALLGGLGQDAGFGDLVGLLRDREAEVAGDRRLVLDALARLGDFPTLEGQVVSGEADAVLDDLAAAIKDRDETLTQLLDGEGRGVSLADLVGVFGAQAEALNSAVRSADLRVDRAGRDIEIDAPSAERDFAESGADAADSFTGNLSRRLVDNSRVVESAGEQLGRAVVEGFEAGLRSVNLPGLTVNLGGNVPGLAAGAVIAPRPGGVLARLAENGHQEVALNAGTSRARQLDLLSEFDGGRLLDHMAGGSSGPVNYILNVQPPPGVNPKVWGKQHLAQLKRMARA